MATETWPSTPGFPQVPLFQGFAQSEKTATIRSPMGYGPAKVRRRTTAAIQPVNISLMLSSADKDTLITFYDVTVRGGSERFNWIDHLKGGAVEYRFTAPIQWSPRSCDLWLAVMNFEILP